MTEERGEFEPREKTGEMMHGLAEQAREEGRFTDALNFTDEATILYQREGNIVKLSEVLSSRFLTFRHLFEQTNDSSYKILAKHAVEASVDIISQSDRKDGYGIAIYNLAKWYQTSGEIEEAIDATRRALKAFEDAPDDPMGIPGQIAEMKTRLTALEYQHGDDSAKTRFEDAVSDLETNKHPDEYVQNVWLSGAHMHMAEAMLKREDKEAAINEIEKAKEIIQSDNRLTLRVGQLAKLSEKIT